jgi:hypothetical protein
MAAMEPPHSLVQSHDSPLYHISSTHVDEIYESRDTDVEEGIEVVPDSIPAPQAPSDPSASSMSTQLHLSLPSLDSVGLSLHKMDYGKPTERKPSDTRPSEDPREREESILPINSEDAIYLCAESEGLCIGDGATSLTSSEQQGVQRAPTSPLNRHESYLDSMDLAKLRPADAHKERREAMRAQSARENHHDRVPPEDAPPHMQMMILLYQWAAWAMAITDPTVQERMIRWVNGRTLDFMMSGGRVPGYSVEELLSKAGVDPKELYGVTNGDQGGEPPMGSTQNRLPDASGSDEAAPEQGSQDCMIVDAITETPNGHDEKSVTFASSPSHASLGSAGKRKEDASYGGDETDQVRSHSLQWSRAFILTILPGYQAAEE